MRKILIFLSVTLLLVAMAVPAFAAGNASLIVSKSSAYRGDTVTVTVYVSNISSAQTGGIEVTYSSGLELVKGEWLLTGALMTNFDNSSKDGVFALDAPQNLKGNVFRLTFKVKTNAAYGKNTVSVNMRTNKGDVKLDKAATIEVVCKHQWSAWAKWSATHHHRKCSLCGKTEDVAHTYSNACDASCNVCGTTRTVGEHKFSEEYTEDTMDETGHWFACTICGEKKDYEEHTPGEPAGEYTDQTCTVCNYVIEPATGHTHSYEPDVYLNDENNHWQICLGCEKPSEPAAHEYDDSCDDTCNVCQYQRRVLHNEGNVWMHNATNHWKDCLDCDVDVDFGAHTWDAGTVTKEATLKEPGTIVFKCVECQMERSEDLPNLTIPQWVPWWGWLAGGAFAGVLVTFAVTMIIIAAKTKKNSKGKFAEV